METRDGSSDRIKNMTEGPILRQVFSFALPMMATAVFQQLYNIVDALIVGNFVSSGALASLGATAAPIFLMLSLAMGLTGGFSSVMALYFGAQNLPMVKRTLVNAIHITIQCAVIFSLIGITCSWPIMRLLQTPPDVIADAAIYLQICIGGCAGQVFYNAGAAVLRAVGDSKTPLYILIVASVLNVIFDLIFVLALDMGVIGVGIATVTAQWIAAALCLIRVFRHYSIFRVHKDELKPDKYTYLLLLKIGIPQSLQMIFISVGEMTITAVINSMGTATVAAFTSGNRIINFSMLTLNSFSHAYGVFAGQNLGAGKAERIRSGFKRVSVIVILISICIGCLVFVFSEDLIGLFLSDDDAQLVLIKHMGSAYLRIGGVLFPILGMIWLYNNTLRGMGDVSVPMFSGIMELVAKVGISIVCGTMFGYLGVWCANPAAWLLGMIPSMIRYHTGGWARARTKISVEKSQK